MDARTTTYPSPSFLPPFFRPGGGSRPISPRLASSVDADADVAIIDTELGEFYSVWLPFNYGLDSDPV